MKHKESARQRKQKQHEVYKEHIGRLIALFPEVFDRDAPKPLAIGSAEMLLSMPSLQMDDDTLAAVLGCWCSRREYVRAAHELRQRWNVLGVPVGPIIDWQQQRFDKAFRKMSQRGLYN